MDIAFLSKAAAFALVLTRCGLRTVNPFLGAVVALQPTTLLLLGVSPRTIKWDQWHNQRAMIFASVSLIFPVVVTALTFHANQLIGPYLTGSLGNLTALFAVVLAVLLLSEPKMQANELEFPHLHRYSSPISQR